MLLGDVFMRDVDWVYPLSWDSRSAKRGTRSNNKSDTQRIETGDGEMEWHALFVVDVAADGG